MESVPVALPAGSVVPFSAKNGTIARRCSGSRSSVLGLANGGGRSGRRRHPLGKELDIAPDALAVSALNHRPRTDRAPRASSPNAFQYFGRSLQPTTDMAADKAGPARRRGNIRMRL